MDNILLEVSSKTYNTHFQTSPHPYIQSDFIDLNQNKVEKIVRLLENEKKVSMGLVAGISRNVLKSPFSAPFGGFHFRTDNQYISEIEKFIIKLINYAKVNCISSVELTLPPFIYHESFNSKVINVLLRNGFEVGILDITNWLDLKRFNGSFTNRTSRKFAKQAQKHNLRFSLLDNQDEKEEAFNIILRNRTRFERQIHMTYQDLENTSKLWPVNFFCVYDKKNVMISSGVFYQGHNRIIQGVFWGDREVGRSLRAIDFLSLNIWNYYKDMGYDAIDLGISTEMGIPNEGLIRFKESHDCISSLRYSLFKKIK